MLEDADRRKMEAAFLCAVKAGATRDEALKIAAQTYVAENPPTPSALDIEFERVRIAANARSKAEREAAEAAAAARAAQQRDEDAAVAAILDAMALTNGLTPNPRKGT